MNTLQYLGTFSREQNKPTLPLTPAWPGRRIPQGLYCRKDFILVI